MIRLILLPLLVVAALTFLIFWSGIMAEFGKFEMIAIALLSFCALLTIYNFLRINLSLFQRSERWSGIADVEKEFNEKIMRLEKRHGGQNGYHLHDERIRILEAETKTLTDSEWSETKTDNTNAVNFQTSDNVVSLGKEVKKRAGSDRRKPNQDEDENIPTGLNIEEHFALFLNPIFEIPDRDVVALEAIFGLYNPKDGQRHIFRRNGLSLSARTIRKLAQHSIRAAGNVMLEMERTNERVPLIFDITGALKDTESCWEIVFNVMRKDPVFHDMFIAQIKMDTYLKLSERQKDRFAVLREIGISVCISECKGMKNTIETIEKGVFECATIAATELVRYGADKKAQFIEKVKPIANDHDMKIIATNINSEEHIVTMLDHEIDMVQGSLLSKPLLAKSGKSELIANEVS